MRASDSERATRPERAGEAPRERACKGDKNEGHAGAWPAVRAGNVGRRLHAAGPRELPGLEAFAAEHGAALRRAEGHGRFLVAGGTVGRRFHALAAHAAGARRARCALGFTALA